MRIGFVRRRVALESTPGQRRARQRPTHGRGSGADRSSGLGRRAVGQATCQPGPVRVVPRAPQMRSSSAPGRLQPYWQRHQPDSPRRQAGSRTSQMRIVERLAEASADRSSDNRVECKALRFGWRIGRRRGCLAGWNGSGRWRRWSRPVQARLTCTTNLASDLQGCMSTGTAESPTAEEPRGSRTQVG